MDNVLTPEARRWRTCVHEAGHAVAALLLGRAGIGAVVFDEGGGLATPTPETDTPPRAADYTPEKLDPLYRSDDWKTLLLDATFAAAGQAAVDLLLHPEKMETSVNAADRAMMDAAARAAIGNYSDFYTEMHFNYMVGARARCLLKPFLWRVERVAKALDKKSKLSADQIIEAMYPEHVRLAKDETETANINTTPEERP